MTFTDLVGANYIIILDPDFCETLMGVLKRSALVVAYLETHRCQNEMVFIQATYLDVYQITANTDNTYQA